MSQNFLRVTSQKLALGEVEGSQEFPEVKQSKCKNCFLTMDSLNRDISNIIFNFQIG